MKQLIQHLRSGLMELIDAPCPHVARGQLLIQTRASLISAGTERFLVEFGKAGLLQKARRNPDRVKQVWQKIKTDGLWPTLEAVFAKLDEPLPLGYCNVGHVLEVGEQVADFSPGNRVVSNGHHAEAVLVGKNLCAKIPDNVTDEQASFAVLGAIGLQGIRLLQPGLGETVAVYGLGLIGLIAAQLLVNSGVRVLGIDLDPARLKMAESYGAMTVNPAIGDPIAAAMTMTAGQGVDGVLITASAKNDTIVSQSAQMSRKRGKIVLVGVVNLELNRAEWYHKELSFQVSCSYGPGRYDPVYEERGQDYPLPFVRWTEQRNIAAVLDQLSRGKLNVDGLLTSRIPFAEAEKAYELLTGDRSQLGILLQYPKEPLDRPRLVTTPLTTIAPTATGSVMVGMIGAGGFGTRVLLPAIKQTNVRLIGIASAKGLSAAQAARKFGFEYSSADYRQILEDSRINTVFICTRHSQHADMVAEALAAGKHVFVEKPLAIDAVGLQRVTDAYAAQPERHLLVGFNRRFSPHARALKNWLAARSEPATLNMLVNAGKLLGEHWITRPEISGGRIIGEGCHWFDLFVALLGSPITAVQVNAGATAVGYGDHQSIMLEFADGSHGVIQYLTNGSKSFPKERLTVFCQGQTAEMDNFRRLTAYGCRGLKSDKLWSQDKGHRAEVAEFLAAVAGGKPPLITWNELQNVTRATFAAGIAATTGTRIVLDTAIPAEVA